MLDLEGIKNSIEEVKASQDGPLSDVLGLDDIFNTSDIDNLIAAVERLTQTMDQIAKIDDDQMSLARTIHYDMRGWARAALIAIKDL